MVTVFFSDSVLDRSIDSVLAKPSYHTSTDETYQILNSLRQRGVQINSSAEARNVRGDRSFFVGQDSVERAEALKAGFAAAIPHPRLVSEVLEGNTLVYARVTGLNNNYSDQRLDRFLNLPVVPVYFNQAQGYAYLITSARAASLIASMGFGVSRFNEQHDPQVTDLYLLSYDLNDADETSGTQIAAKFLAQQNKARFIAGTEE